MLKAGDGEGENVVKGDDWRREDDIMRISVGEISCAVHKMNGEM